MKLLKRSGKEINLKLENGNLIPEVGKLGQRDSVFFICKKCEKEASRRISLFPKLNNLTDRDFYCQQCNTKENNLEKYGVENTMQIKEVAEKCALSFKDNNNIEEIIKKRKETNLEKYGNENFTNQKKREETNLEKYGVKTLLEKEEIRELRNKEVAYKNSRESMKSKYGTSFPSQEKTKEITFEILNNLEGFTLLTKKENYKNKFQNVELKCNKCGTEFFRSVENILYVSQIPNCPKCTPYGESSYERELRTFLDDLGIEHIDNTRDIIKPFEIDVYIPSIKLGIELNGLYWHSEKFKDKNYHNKKYLLAKENGIELWQFFEDEWVNQKNIILGKIKLKLGFYEKKIFGRKCEVRTISKKETDFILKDHLIGPDSSSVKVGLFYENELVSAMTFKKKENGYILNRYISKSGYIVIGAFSKLLKFFERNYIHSFIESFSENRYSYGDVYLKNGFKKEYETTSDYWYIIGNKREHKFGYRRDSIIKKFNLTDEGLSEREMMQNLGILRIYNAGLSKWVKV